MINNLRKFRKEKGITQKELADFLGISRQTIIAIETNKYNPTLEIALKLSYFFSTTVNDIFVNTEAKAG